MGNVSSSRSADNNVFKNELTKLNHIVTSIINDKDLFKNSKYNFLSQEVCNKYQIILEDELSKHLKLSVKSLGTSLYIVPKNEEVKLSNVNITKKEICEKISNHYLKILYILTLVKYVYNIEKDGDLSIAGIAFRNIRVLDDVMEINFCDIPHKNYRAAVSARGSKQQYKIDFSNLEGFKFFIEYFLEKPEAHVFLGVLRAILARVKKGEVKEKICNHQGEFDVKEFKQLEEMYLKRYGEKLQCGPKKTAFKSNHIPSVTMDVFINKDNPIFSQTYCSSMRNLIIKTNTKEGREVMSLYQEFKRNYNANLHLMMTILDKLVIHQKNGNVVLRDIDKNSLDQIIYDVKSTIKTFYLQSIVDFQRILDKAKGTPKLESSLVD